MVEIMAYTKALFWPKAVKVGLVNLTFILWSKSYYKF